MADEEEMSLNPMVWPWREIFGAMWFMVRAMWVTALILALVAVTLFVAFVPMFLLALAVCSQLGIV